MASITIRAAKERDDAFFEQIESQTSWDSLSLEDQARLFPAAVREVTRETDADLLNSPGMEVFVAEDEERRRVGIIWLGPCRNVLTGEPEAWIYSVGVAPERQGEGVGRLLLDHAEEWARTAGYKRLGLMVSAHNQRALGIYERRGFTPSTLVMRKTLATDPGDAKDPAPEPPEIS